MKRKEHCNICDCKIYTEEKELLCGITNEVPDFTDACETIKLDKSLKAEIVAVHSELKILENARSGIMKDLVLLTIITLIVIATAYYIQVSELTEYPIIPFTIFAVAILVAIAIRPLQRYKRDWNIANKKREKLNNLVKKYKYDYEVTIEILKNEVGEFDIKKSVKLLRIK